jgi:hypothetical protein
LIKWRETERGGGRGKRWQKEAKGGTDRQRSRDLKVCRKATEVVCPLKNNKG